MSKWYAVLGAGRIGVAAAYHLCRQGDTAAVVLCDINRQSLRKGAKKIRRLLKEDNATSRLITKAVDLRRSDSLFNIIKNLKIDACLSTVDFNLSFNLAQQTMEANCHFNDLGGNNYVTEQIINDYHYHYHKSVVLDCGLAPGLMNIIARDLIAEFTPTTANIKIYCGGLPISSKLPFGYELQFSSVGLWNEYVGGCYRVAGGEFQLVPPLSEHEHVDPFQGFESESELEAFTTSGGASDEPSVLGLNKIVNHYEYKTIRYKGHVNAMQTLSEFGVLCPSREKPFVALANKLWGKKTVDDVVLGRVIAQGKVATGETKQFTTELLVQAGHQVDGFTAMAQATAFSAARITMEQARGNIGPGARTAATAENAKKHIEHLKSIGFKINTRVSSL